MEDGSMCERDIMDFGAITWTSFATGGLAWTPRRPQTVANEEQGLETLL